LNKTTKFQGILTLRVIKLLQIINEQYSQLSLAEKLYHKQLHESNSKIPLLSQKINEVKILKK
jgi:hypothetical protein